MDQLYQMTALLAKALFKKESPIIPEGAFPENSEPGIILARIRQLVDEHKINTAENLLFDVFDKQKPYFIAIGLELYARLSEMSDETLEEADFSRDEIKDGINDMLNFYGVKITVRKNPPPPDSEYRPEPAPNVLAKPPRKP
jgi:hypothetical protein